MDVICHAKVDLRVGLCIGHVGSLARSGPQQSARRWSVPWLESFTRNYLLDPARPCVATMAVRRRQWRETSAATRAGDDSKGVDGRRREDGGQAAERRVGEVEVVIHTEFLPPLYADGARDFRELFPNLNRADGVEARSARGGGDGDDDDGDNNGGRNNGGAIVAAEVVSLVVVVVGRAEAGVAEAEVTILSLPSS